MPIEMPKGLPFSVDTWTPQSRCKRHHFLTHAHRDHLAGIASHFSYPIYATKFTKSAVLRNFQQVAESAFVEIDVGETRVVKDPDGDFMFMVFDANHCPGAVMFLFEGEFGNILHTGDCRLTPDCLQHLPMKYITKKGKQNLCHLDYLFLDCTFGRCSLQIPSKQSAIEQVINCVWKHPDAPVVYLACDMLGQEEILVQISRTFGSKIYVDKTNSSECFHTLSFVAPEILSQDAASRFQVIEGFPRLNERASQKLAEARANLQPGPLFVRPSVQWYANNDQLEMTQAEKPGLLEAARDEIGIWHVCYSMHSTREELEWALNLLQPKWVISTTPPCRAMELDYVKKHCYKTRITSDDPLWKLLRASSGKSASLSSCVASEANNVSITPAVEASAVSVASHQSANHIELKLDLSPLSNTRTVTLFGRARLGLSNTDLLQEKKSETSDVMDETKDVSLQDDIIIDHVSTVQGGGIAEPCPEKLVEGVDIKRNVHMVSEQNLKIAVNNAGPTVDNVEVIDEENDVCCVRAPAKLVEDTDVKENVHLVSVQNLKSVDGGGSLTKTSCSVEYNVENLEVANKERVVSCIGSSVSLNDSLKKLYRSMNAPVPRPLPSLVELVGASNKRVRHSSASDGLSSLNYCYDSSCYSSS